MANDSVIELYHIFHDQIILKRNLVKKYLPVIDELGIKTPKCYLDLLSYHDVSLRLSLRFDAPAIDSGGEGCGIGIIKQRYNRILKLIKEHKYMFYPTLESIILDKMKENDCDLNLIPFIKSDVVDS